MRDLVHRGHTGMRAVNGVHGALIGLAAGLVCLAAAVLSAGDLTRDGWIASVVAGLLAGLSWCRAAGISEAQTAAEIDVNLNLDGALVTAYEAELRAQPRSRESSLSLADLLCRRVLAHVTPRRALAAVRPAMNLPIAAPLIAAGILFIAREETAPADAAPEIARMSRSIGAELGRAQGLLGDQNDAGDSAKLGAGVNPAGLSLRLGSLRDRSAELERDLSHLSAAEAEAELRQIQDELQQISRELDPSGALGGSLATARAWVEAARSQSGVAQEDGVGTEAGRAQSPSSAAESGSNGSAKLAPGAGSGKMSDPSVAGKTPVAQPGPIQLAQPEGAAAGGIWWPEDRAGLVARWIEARRRALATD